jgi:hypothetical protein
MYTQEIACPGCGNLAVVNVPDKGTTTTPCRHCKASIQVAVDRQGKVSGISKVGGCFIASTCYGSPCAPQVDALRRFRDRYLITHWLGQQFVMLYYRYSPDVAARLVKHPWLASFIRILLLNPLVYLVVRQRESDQE